MKIKDISPGFSPDIGLERIDWENAYSPTLPSQHETQLTGERVYHRVNELFSGDSIEQTLRQFISPSLSKPTILTPVRFEGLVRESTQIMQHIATTLHAPRLERASELLTEELQLRQLLATYRTLLTRA